MTKWSRRRLVRNAMPPLLLSTKAMEMQACLSPLSPCRFSDFSIMVHCAKLAMW